MSSPFTVAIACRSASYNRRCRRKLAFSSQEPPVKSQADDKGDQVIDGPEEDRGQYRLLEGHAKQRVDRGHGTFLDTKATRDHREQAHHNPYGETSQEHPEPDRATERAETEP